MRVAITRPLEDADRTASALRQRGLTVILEPLLVVAPCAVPPMAMAQMASAQAWLLTSANGVRALAEALHQTGAALSAPWDRPALCVGDQTARTAQAAGFTDVHSAAGDVQSLAVLTCRLLRPQQGPLFHAAASVQAGDLAALLGEKGFHVDRAVLYETRPATAFSPAFDQCVRQHQLDAVLLYSPRTAQTFATLAREAKLSPHLSTVTAYCLSPAVAEALSSTSLSDASELRVRIAPHPTQDALLSILDQDRASSMKGDTP